MQAFKSAVKSLTDLPEESRRVAFMRAVFIGMAAGLAALILENGAYWLSYIRVKASSVYSAWIVLPACGLLGGLISGFLVQKYSPTAYGSGIPQVRAYLLGARQPLDLKLALVKLIAGSIALGSGLFMGREGPTVHVGAAISAHINKWFPSAKEQQKQLVAAGAGAGLAAAFNAPIAGVLFVAEELLKDVSPHTMGTAILACFVASTLTHLFNAPHMESARQIQDLDLAFTFHDILFWILLGLSCGILGTVFNRGVLFFLKIYRDYVKIPVMLRVGLAGLISGCIIALIPADAHFRDYAALRDVIVAGHSAWYMVPLAFVAFFFLTLIAYGSGAPGGLFAPAIVLGSAVGAMVAYLENYIFGVGSVETMAMVGMGAFFAAVARVPITAIVIVTEITKHYNLVPPLMVASATACFIGSKLERGSVYDMLRDYSGLNQEIRRIREEEQQVKVRDLMKPAEHVLNLTIAKPEWHQILGCSYQTNIPVSDQDKFIGMIKADSVGARIVFPNEIELADLVNYQSIAVLPDMPITEANALFIEQDVDCLPVVENDRFLGLIYKNDICPHLLLQEVLID